MDRRVAIGVALFVAGMAGDNLLTYEYVVRRGIVDEANPVVELVWLGKPLWAWFLRDLAFLALILAAYYVLSRLQLTARLAWLVPVTVGALRFAPLVHNAVFILTGYESPLAGLVERIACEIMVCMGGLAWSAGA